MGMSAITFNARLKEYVGSFGGKDHEQTEAIRRELLAHVNTNGSIPNLGVLPPEVQRKLVWIAVADFQGM